MQRQSASLVRPWMLALAVACAIYPDYTRGQFLKRFRSCTLPHERRAWMWQRTEQYCSAGRTLEYRRRSQPCVCQTGYYRDEETNNCYDARRCGQCDSSKHERFNSCTNDCEAVCGKQVIQQCDKPCVPGCECKKGYIRKYKKGPCVPIQTCPPKCPAYMTFEMERERCPRICNVAREDGCSETNEGPGCACRKGFVLRAPFGTVRTRVWCIHESMCTFPDEEKGPARNQVGKGGHSFQRNGAATKNRFWAPSRGRHGLEMPMPKRNDDDLFFDDKGFPPLGNLANKGGQVSELGQTKLGRDDGEFTQGKGSLGNDKTWRWNRGQRGYQGSLPQKFDEDLFQDNKGFPPLGGLVQKKDQEFNFGQERIGFKGSREGYGARTISKNNAWGWSNRPRSSESSAVKKSDKDLYLGADQFSNLGYRRYKPLQGSQLGQREVGLSGSYNDRYVGHTKGQYSKFVQGSSIARKRGGSSFHWKKFRGDQERMGLGGTGRERGQNFDMDDWLSGHQSTGAIPNFANSPGDQEGLMPTKVVDDWTPDKGLLQKGGSSKGGLPPSLKGASDLPGVGLPVGTLPELPKLGENGAPGGVPGLEVPTGNLSSLLDMLEAQVGSQNSGNEPGQIVILGHGGKGTKAGHLNSGTEKKNGAVQFSSNMKGLPGISIGTSSFPGAGLGVGKLPELPKLSDNGASVGLPGAQAPTGKVSNILDTLEAQVGSQKNEPGQIEILGHGGIGTKLSNLRSVTVQKEGAADITQQNETITTRPLLQPAKQVPTSVPSLTSLNEQKQSEELTRQGSQVPYDNRAQPNATSSTQPNEMLSAIAEFQGANAVIPPSGASSAYKSQQPERKGFTGQNWLAHKGNTVQPSSIGWTQLEPSSGYSQLQGGNDRFARSGATLAPNNQPESKGQGWKPSQSTDVEPDLVDKRQRSEPLGISLPTRETAIAPLYGPTVASSNRQPESTDYTGYDWQTPQGNSEQPNVVEWTQQPSSENLGFRRTNVPVPQPLPTVSYDHKQRQNAGFIGRGWETLQSNTAQPSVVEWTPPKKSSPRVSQMQGATSYVSFPGATVVSTKKRTQSLDFGSRAQPGVFEWTQQKKPPSRIVREATARFRLLRGSGAYINRQPEKTVYTHQSWQTPQGSMAQPGLIDGTQNIESLSDISQRPTTTPSTTPPGPVASWANEQPQNTDFTAQGRLPYNRAQPATVVISNTEKANQELTSQFTQVVPESMTKFDATGWVQQNAPFANFRQVQSETASAASFSAADAPINKVKSSTVAKLQRFKMNHSSLKKPGALDLKEQNMSLSRLPNLQKETTSVPPHGGTVASSSNKNEIMDNINDGWQEGKVKGTESDTVKGAHKNETLLRLEKLHSGTSSQTLAAPVVASKSTSKINDRLSGGNSRNPSSQTAQSVRTDIKQQDKQSAKDTGFLKAPVPLPAAAVSSKEEPNKGRDLRGQGSRMGEVIEGQTGTQSVNAGKETTTILANEKKTIGHQILSSGIQFGKRIFGGLSNVLPFGGLFQYYPPVASTEQMPIEAYPDVYGTYSVQGEPFFGETFIPFGYPTVYPTPYVPMTDMWGQPYGMPGDLQAQQEPAQESGVPASPAPVSNLSAQKKQAEVSKSEVKGAAGSGAEYKITAGAVPVAKNYTFDGSSPNSS